MEGKKEKSSRKKYWQGNPEVPTLSRKKSDPLKKGTECENGRENQKNKKGGD